MPSALCSIRATWQKPLPNAAACCGQVDRSPSWGTTLILIGGGCRPPDKRSTICCRSLAVIAESSSRTRQSRRRILTKMRLARPHLTPTSFQPNRCERCAPASASLHGSYATSIKSRPSANGRVINYYGRAGQESAVSIFTPPPSSSISELAVGIPAEHEIETDRLSGGSSQPLETLKRFDFQAGLRLSDSKCLKNIDGFWS